jgi:hypothetical protein
MKYQIVCPECKHEFSFDNGYLDKNIARLGTEIYDIMAQLSANKLLPRNEQDAAHEWWLSAKHSLHIKQKELASLKAIRKSGRQQVDSVMFRAFKEAVKSEVGESRYLELLALCEKELEAYNLTDLMKSPYSRAHGEAITSVNKI